MNNFHFLFWGRMSFGDEWRTPLNNIRLRFVLPDHFPGSELNMKKRFLSASTLCSTFDHPDLFITFTYSPNWASITTNIF